MSAAVAPLQEPAAIRPRVSVIIPCRNEVRYIAECLDSILGNDYPSDRLDVIVVDGASDDGTVDILDAYAARDPRVRRIDNPARTTPAALNTGLGAASGDVVMRVDAHCRYPRDYITGLVHWLEASGADNVGGVCRTIPGKPSPLGRAIAIALSHPFAVGNAHFRIGAREPRWVDTVPFGCYRRAVFDHLGGFDPDLIRNQDDEFNHRLIARGGKILLVPGIVTEYFARDSLGKLARMYYQYGYFKPLVGRKLGHVATVRQLIPPLFVATVATEILLAPLGARAATALAIVAAAYFGAATIAAGRELPRHGYLVAAWLLATFPVVHLSYGAGFWHGILDFIVRRRGGVTDAARVKVSR